MFTPFFQLCIASAAVTQLIGTRIYLNKAPQPRALPYVVYKLVGGEPENYLKDKADADHIDLRIYIYAKDDDQLELIFNAIRSAIEDDCYITRLVDSDTDPDTNDSVAIFDADFIIKR